MYGFGDDRNPSNDTVNVMEEILVEYIIDVVSHPECQLHTISQQLSNIPHSVSGGSCAREEVAVIDRGP